MERTHVDPPCTKLELKFNSGGTALWVAGSSWPNSRPGNGR